MTCGDCKDWTADADETGVPEAAREHVAGCASCRAERERQLAVRTLLRSKSVLPAAPIGLRTRILAALEEEEAAAPAAGGWRRFFGYGGLALATAVALVVLVGLPRGEFAPLIRGYDLAVAGKLELGFRTDAPAALEQFFARHSAERIPSHVVDLTSAGFHLVGGALTDFPKRRARLAVYSDGRDWVVCDYQYAKDFPLSLPSNGQSVFFERDGMSFSAHRVGDEVCLLATRMKLEAFRRRLVGETAVG